MSLVDIGSCRKGERVNDCKDMHKDVDVMLALNRSTAPEDQGVLRVDSRRAGDTLLCVSVYPKTCYNWFYDLYMRSSRGATAEVRFEGSDQDRSWRAEWEETPSQGS